VIKRVKMPKYCALTGDTPDGFKKKVDRQIFIENIHFKRLDDGVCKKLTILRCGWCGCFCDNAGRVFMPSKQLIFADEQMGFDHGGECLNCNSSLLDDIDEQELNNKLADIRRAANEKMSTGKWPNKLSGEKQR